VARACVSIPTDDEIYVKAGHFGDARFYLHYVLEDDGWKLARRVENPYAGVHGHGRGHGWKREHILELNRGCTHIVAVAFGPGGAEFMRSHGIQIITVSPDTKIEEALAVAQNLL
jgi:predicted Fe-Mo cluster-binding NifX family protein